MLRRHIPALLWLLLAIAGAVALAVGFPRAFPFLPQDWSVNAREAEAIALEALRDLGDPVADPYVVTRLRTDGTLERRMQTSIDTVGREPLLSSRLSEQAARWSVRVYAPDQGPNQFTYQAAVDLENGRVLQLEKRRPPDEGEGGLDAAEARRRAEAYLESLGVERELYWQDPEVRREDVEGRSDIAVRFQDREDLLDGVVRHGVEVSFAGDQLEGHGPWLEDDGEEELEEVFQTSQLVLMSRSLHFAVFLLIAAVPFLRRYHDGQLGVRRSTHLLLLALGGALLYLTLNVRTMTEGTSVPLLTRQQLAWFVGSFAFLLQFLGLALLAFVSWAVGESVCREVGWGHKLAAWDALLRGKWRNATVARSSFRGFSAGLATAGLAMLATIALRRFDAWPIGAFLLDLNHAAAIPAASLFAGMVSWQAPMLLFTVLMAASWARGRFGARGGLVVAILIAIIALTPSILVLPLSWGLVPWVITAAVPALVFWRWDLWSALLSGLVASTSVAVQPLLHASDAWLEANGWAALLLIAAPALVSLRWLFSEEEFVYTWDDVPPHVRRIAERERQAG